MSETKHTPGPWTVQRMNHAADELWLQIGFYDSAGREIGPICEVIGGCVKGEPGSVAVMQYLVATDDVVEANARLIAASPSLLEALERLTDSADLFEQLTPADVRERAAALRQAREAIDKATNVKTNRTQAQDPAPPVQQADEAHADADQGAEQPGEA